MLPPTVPPRSTVGDKRTPAPCSTETSPAQPPPVPHHQQQQENLSHQQQLLNYHHQQGLLLDLPIHERPRQQQQQRFLPPTLPAHIAQAHLQLQQQHQQQLQQPRHATLPLSPPQANGQQCFQQEQTKPVIRGSKTQEPASSPKVSTTAAANGIFTTGAHIVPSQPDNQMLNLYISDYLHKLGFNETCAVFTKESCLRANRDGRSGTPAGRGVRSTSNTSSITTSNGNGAANGEISGMVELKVPVDNGRPFLYDLFEVFKPVLNTLHGPRATVNAYALLERYRHQNEQIVAKLRSQVPQHFPQPIWPITQQGQYRLAVHHLGLGARNPACWTQQEREHVTQVVRQIQQMAAHQNSMTERRSYIGGNLGTVTPAANNFQQMMAAHRTRLVDNPVPSSPVVLNETGHGSTHEQMFALQQQNYLHPQHQMRQEPRRQMVLPPSPSLQANGMAHSAPFEPVTCGPNPMFSPRVSTSGQILSGFEQVPQNAVLPVEQSPANGQQVRRQAKSQGPSTPMKRKNFESVSNGDAEMAAGGPPSVPRNNSSALSAAGYAVRPSTPSNGHQTEYPRWVPYPHTMLRNQSVVPNSVCVGDGPAMRVSQEPLTPVLNGAPVSQVLSSSLVASFPSSKAKQFSMPDVTAPTVPPVSLPAFSNRHNVGFETLVAARPNGAQPMATNMINDGMALPGMHPLVAVSNTNGAQLPSNGARPVRAACVANGPQGMRGLMGSLATPPSFNTSVQDQLRFLQHEQAVMLQQRQRALYTQMRRKETATGQGETAQRQFMFGEDAEVDDQQQAVALSGSAQLGSQPLIPPQPLPHRPARNLPRSQVPVLQQSLPQPGHERPVPQMSDAPQPPSQAPTPPPKRRRLSEQSKPPSQRRRTAASATKASGTCPARRMSAPDVESSQTDAEGIKAAQPKRHSAGDLQQLVHSGFPDRLSSAADVMWGDTASDNQLIQVGGAGAAQTSTSWSDFLLADNQMEGIDCTDPYVTGSNSADFFNSMFSGCGGENDIFSIHSDKSSHNFQSLQAGLDCPVSLESHQGKVCSCAFSFDGAWLATAGVDRKVIVWSTAEALDSSAPPAVNAAVPPKIGAKFVLTGHDAQINCVRWCSDGRYLLATASYDKTVRVWDIREALAKHAAGALPAGPDGIEITSSLCVFAGHSQTVTAVDFCREVGSELLASVDGDGCLKYWNCRSGVVEKEIRLPCISYSMNPVRFNPRQASKAAVCFGKELAIVDYVTENVDVVSTRHQKNIHSVEWSANGANVVTASDDKVCVWNIALGTSSFAAAPSPSASARPCATLLASFDSSDKISSVAFVGDASGMDSRVIFGGYQNIYDWRDIRKDEAGFSNCHQGVIVGMDTANVPAVEGSSAGDSKVVLASVSSMMPGNVKIWKVTA